MAKTETNVSKLKINRGTYSNIQANIGQIGNDELIIITDKQVPIPVQADSGKVVTVNSSGDYELQTPSAGMSNPMTAAGDLIVGGSSGTPARLGVGTAGQVLKSNGSGVEWGSSGEIDSDVTVEIESDYTNDSYASRTNYAAAISLQEFIANCEAGNVYTNDGIIAKMNNYPMTGKSTRFILIGRNHEKLALDNTTTVNTTWQFLDMPMDSVALGLPFDLFCWDGSFTDKAGLMDILSGVNTSSKTLYPSNIGGIISANGLLEASKVVFESLPILLKKHIKLVRRQFYCHRDYMTAAANGGNLSGIESTSEYMSATVFHLTSYEATSLSPTEGTAYTYLTTANANRIRFWNGTAKPYWIGSPYFYSSTSWSSISDYGNYENDFTRNSNAVAPAFCI